MDPVVCLFRPRLLQGQDREDARCSQGSYSHSPSPSPPPKPPPSPLPSVCHPLLHSSKAFPSSVPVGRGSLKAPTPTTPPPSFPVSPQASHSVLLHKVDEGRALHLHRLPLPVIHGQHEVEEVGFPEVGRGLLLKVCSCQAHTTAGRKAAGNCWKPPEASALQKDPITSEQDSALTWQELHWTGPCRPWQGRLSSRQRPPSAEITEPAPVDISGASGGIPGRLLPRLVSGPYILEAGP